MDDRWLFILKLLIISAAISVAIKYGAPWLNIPATSAVALVFVLTPSFVLGGILLWRGWQFQKQKN
jgi:membrane protein YdbS with pleckstrin-like domain